MPKCMPAHASKALASSVQFQLLDDSIAELLQAENCAGLTGSTLVPAWHGAH